MTSWMQKTGFCQIQVGTQGTAGGWTAVKDRGHIPATQQIQLLVVARRLSAYRPPRPSGKCTAHRRYLLSIARYPIAVESGGHSMWQLDARDVLQGVRVENREFAAVGATVIHITHQHAVVFCRVGG